MCKPRSRNPLHLSAKDLEHSTGVMEMGNRCSNGSFNVISEKEQGIVLFCIPQT